MQRTRCTALSVATQVSVLLRFPRQLGRRRTKRIDSGRRPRRLAVEFNAPLSNGNLRQLGQIRRTDVADFSIKLRVVDYDCHILHPRLEKTMNPRSPIFWLSLAALALFCAKLSAEDRQVVLQLDPELHKHFSQDVRANARRWFALFGSTQPVQVLQLKEKPNTSQNPAYILSLRLGRTWWHGQNHRQFVLQGENENAIGGGMKKMRSAVA